MNEQAASEEYEKIKQCLAGDREAFSHLVDKYKSLAYNVAYRMLGDEDSANDMAQESFIAAYQGLKDFHFDAKFSTWLYRIVLNKCKDHMRTEKNTISVDLIAEVKASGASSPEDDASGSESRDVIQQALRKLPHEYREAVVLKHLEELDYEEMSHILGVGVGALKVRAHRGREMLKKLLEEAGVTHG